MPGLIDKGGGKEYRRGSEGLGARYVQTWLGWPTKWLAGELETKFIEASDI